jgi:hypothetical protein
MQSRIQNNVQIFGVDALLRDLKPAYEGIFFLKTVVLYAHNYGLPETLLKIIVQQALNN